MSSPGRHPFDLVAQVLSERLRGCEASAALRAMVCARGLDWERVLRHASAQLVLPAFAAALRDLGLTGSLDGELGAFLEAVHAANLERNGELRDELAAVVRILNRVDIQPTLLKGALRLLDGLYPDQGWRMLRDLDLLVPEARWEQALEVLQRTGYGILRIADTEALLRRPRGPVAIDLHKEVFATPRASRVLSSQDMLQQARHAVMGDAAVRLPSLVHQVVHLIAHSQISNHNYAYGRIAFRDRLEAAALVRWAAEPIEWQAVAAHFATAGCPRPLLAFVLALRDGALCAVPPPGRIDALTALQERRIAWQARCRMLAHLSFWPMWCMAMLRSQVEERKGGRPKLVDTLRRLLFERGAGQRMLRTFIYDAPRPWMLVFLSAW